MIASVYFRRCGSYRMYLESDSPYQVVMIVCELNNFAIFFTYNTQYSLLFLIHMQIQCDLVITSFTCVNVCLLNCLNLVFEI